MATTSSIDIEPGGYDLVVLGHVCRAEGAEGARRVDPTAPPTRCGPAAG